MRRIHIALAILLVSLSTSLSQAATLQFNAILDGAQETPPVVTPATGVGTLFLDDVTGAYTISGSFQDLIGTSNNAHIHGPAAIGQGPAGVVAPLTFDFGVNTGTYSGAGTFTAQQMSELISGLYYVNIHSTFRPGGEIRGQLLLVPEPGTGLLLSLGIAGLSARRRIRRVRAS